MRIGTLNRWITLQRRVTSRGAAGGPDYTWELIESVWASISHPSGSETVRGEVPVGATRASIRVRFREDLDATCRVLHGTVIYDIKSVLPDDVRREFVDLVCEAGVNNG